MSLINRLKAQIEETGPVPLSEFMEQVLYDPEYGYYHQKVPIGREGDYITAPEMTQVFGEVIAVWLIDIWQQAGRPMPFHLVELGPGRGTLMVDMLRTFQSLKMPLAEMTVHLIDISPTLKAIQRQTLASFPLSFHWHESVDTLPEGFSLMVGNEFWDAFPIRQMIVNNPNSLNCFERCVGLKDNQLVFVPENPKIIYEFSSATHLLADKIIDHFVKNRGAALFLDYGHNSPDATGDTLQAVFQHQRCSPLEHIGQADLTHHVDFHNLKESLGYYGLSVHGPIPQGDFLKAMGLDIRTERLCERATPEQRGALRTAAVRLTHLAHMGTLFKAMGVVSDESLRPSGFDSPSFA